MWRLRHPTLLTAVLNLCHCMVQSQELVHVNSSWVRGPNMPFCVVLTRTAFTFAYELGLERSLARWKANEKLHPKILSTSSTSSQCAFGILPCRCETFENEEYHWRGHHFHAYSLHSSQWFWTYALARSNPKSSCTLVLVEFVDPKYRFVYRWHEQP